MIIYVFFFDSLIFELEGTKLCVWYNVFFLSFFISKLFSLPGFSMSAEKPEFANLEVQFVLHLVCWAPWRLHPSYNFSTRSKPGLQLPILICVMCVKFPLHSLFFWDFSEIPKTETNFEERLILKAFLLKFMNAYAPIFYVAFFKGR